MRRRVFALLLGCVLPFLVGPASGAFALACGGNAVLASLDTRTYHSGGLNNCGCHVNRKTGECHCHRASGCGCACEPDSCKGKK